MHPNLQNEDRKALPELEEVLRTHAERYGLMQPTDAVKLIYQNEFGGGHLISDPDRVLGYLRGEYEATPKNGAASKYESIGNGIVRVNLAALTEGEIPALGAIFLQSAEGHRGSTEGFEAKLTLLKRLTEEGIFSFSAQELARYLDGYAKAGYPAVSHSDAYRQAYHPAYRIVLRELICD